MESLKDIAGLILLQVDHNRECGKDDKFTLMEIADIINRRVVLKLHKPVVVGRSEQFTCKHDYQPDTTCGVDITCCTKCGDVI